MLSQLRNFVVYINKWAGKVFFYCCFLICIARKPTGNLHIFCLFTVCSFENLDSHFTGFIVILDFVCLTKNIHYFVSTYFHLRIIPFSKLVLWPLIKVSILGVEAESLLPFHAWLFLACKKRTYFIQGPPIGFDTK